MGLSRGERTEALLREQENLKHRAGILEGRREAARQSLKAVDEEIVARGIEPDRLDEVVTEMEAKFDASLVQVEAEVAAYRANLEEFEKGV